MRCHICRRYNDQGEWPDGQRWCRAVLRKQHDPLRVYLCPSCCGCGGKKSCTPVVVMLVAFFQPEEP